MAATPITIVCRDGVRLGAHLWWTSTPVPHGLLVINPATGVLARYDHRYAQCLAEAGFDVLTYDYHGIGLSCPARLRGCGDRWRDWGELDCGAALRTAYHHRGSGSLQVVGVWAGGKICPPASLANGPSRARTQNSYPARDRAAILERFNRFRAAILAIAPGDDAIGTPAALQRALSYYGTAPQTLALVRPIDMDVASIGHFGLFHARFAETFWKDSLLWLLHGQNPF